MSESDNESICTYYSSSSSSIRSNDETEMDFLDDDEYDEYYDEMEILESENDNNQVEVEKRFRPNVNIEIPSVNPWSKKEGPIISQEEPKSFLEILKEETEKSKVEKIELEKKKEFDKKYKNRPNFNFSNTHNSRARFTKPQSSNKKHVSLLKPLKSKS